MATREIVRQAVEKGQAKVVVYNHDNISTDQIFPGPYGYLTDPKEMAEHLLEGADWTLRKRLQTVGDIFVAGRNFGCGSSREMAVIAFKETDVQAVIVKSAARIWYRNAVNLGLPVLFCESLPDHAVEGGEVEIDLEAGTVRDIATGKVYRGEVPSDFILNIIRLGGLKPLMREKVLSKEKSCTLSTIVIHSDNFPGSFSFHAIYIPVDQSSLINSTSRKHWQCQGPAGHRGAVILTLDNPNASGYPEIHPG